MKLMDKFSQIFELKFVIIFLSICLFTSSNYANKPNIEKFKALLETTTNSDERIQLNLKIALEFYNHGEIKKALEYSVQAEKAIMRYTENDLRGMVHLYEGNFLLELSKYGDALQHFQISYQAYAKEGDLSRMTVVLSSLGVVFERLKNPELALEYNRKVIKNRKELKDTAGLAVAYTNIGNIYEDLEKYELAFNYYSDAAYIDSVYENERNLGIDYNNLGFLFEHLNQYSTAIQYYQKSYEIDKKMDDIYNQSIVLLNMSRINLKLKKYQTANELAQQSLVLSKKAGSIRQLSEIYKLLSEIEKTLNNSPASFSYFKLHIEMEDSMNVELSSLNNDNIKATPIKDLKEKEPQNKLGYGGMGDFIFYVLTFVLLSIVIILFTKLFKK